MHKVLQRCPSPPDEGPSWTFKRIMTCSCRTKSLDSINISLSSTKADLTCEISSWSQRTGMKNKGRHQAGTWWFHYCQPARNEILRAPLIQSDSLPKGHLTFIFLPTSRSSISKVQQLSHTLPLSTYPPSHLCHYSQVYNADTKSHNLSTPARLRQRSLAPILSLPCSGRAGSFLHYSLACFDKFDALMEVLAWLL